MSNKQNETVLRGLNALRLSQRRLVGGVAVAAITAPVAGIQAPRRVAAAGRPLPS